MDQGQAYRANFRGHALSGDGKQGVLVFTLRDGQMLSVAVEAEQLPVLMLGVIDVLAKSRRALGSNAPPVPALPIESWTTSENEEGGFLNLRVRGVELRFSVPAEAVRTSEEP
jgi:hypothetical protein